MTSAATNKSRWALLALITGAGLGACGDEQASDDAAPGNALVFESRQSVQCGSRGITAQQSAQRLINGGLDVTRSGCGVMTGVAFAAVCGGGTGEILLHEIRTANVDDADRLGFAPVEELRNPATGQGYSWVDCQTGAILP